MVNRNEGFLDIFARGCRRSFALRVWCAALCAAGGLFGQSYSVTPIAASDYESQGLALNNNADIAGMFRQNGGAWHAFLYHAGQMVDLNTRLSEPTNPLLTAAVYIGEGDQIIASGVNGKVTQMYLLSPACKASNAETEAVQCYTLSPWGGVLPAGFATRLATSAQPSELPAVPVPQDGMVTLGFNSSGAAVGYSAVSANETHAFLLANGNTVDLNSQIRADSGWTLTMAAAINDFGQIAGTGIYQGQTQAFLLTPIRLSAPNAGAAGTSGTQPASSSASPEAGSGISPGQALAVPADSGSPSGAAGGVLAGTYPNPLLAGITAGPVVFGNGAGTIGQDSSFTFNSSTKQLSLMDAASTFNSATLNVSKGAGSSSTLDLLEADNKGKILRVLQPGDQAHLTPTLYIDNGSGLYMRSWLTISGTTNGLTGDGYNIVPPSNDPLMIGVWADVGTGIQVRTANQAGAYNYSNLDRHGNYTMSIEENGSLRWGTTTRAAMDTGLSRNSAGMLQVNNGTEGSFADLTVRNLITTGGVQFANISSGTGAASLGSNSPAISPAQPFTWVTITLPDGSQGYVPVWK